MNNIAAAILIYFGLNYSVKAEIFSVDLRDRVSSDNGFNLRVKREIWEGQHTAVIVCDMWDSHHCYNAVKRVEQLAPRINKFVKDMRNCGAVIIHAPSSCMNYYKDTVSRKTQKYMSGNFLSVFPFY